MVPTALPNLSRLAYGRADKLTREIAEFVNYAQMNPSSQVAMATWWDAMHAVVDAAVVGEP